MGGVYEPLTFTHIIVQGIYFSIQEFSIKSCFCSCEYNKNKNDITVYGGTGAGKP